MTNFISIIITFLMVLCSHNEFTEKDLIVYLVVLILIQAAGFLILMVNLIYMLLLD